MLNHPKSHHHPMISLNGDWMLVYDPKEQFNPISIKDVNTHSSTHVPSVFNMREDGATYFGVVWYQKTITLPRHEGLFELFCEGWYGKAEFYLDSVLVGARSYGWTPMSMFFFIPNSVKSLKTITISIKIDNRSQPDQTYKTADFISWGGIHRNIEIHALPPVFCGFVQNFSDIDLTTVKGTFFKEDYHALTRLRCCSWWYAIDEDALSKLTISMKITPKSISNKPIVLSESPTEENFAHQLDSEFSYSVINLETGVVFQLKQMFKEYNVTCQFQLWHFERPFLYELEVETIYDSLTYQIGIRDIRTNNEGHLLLNGVRTMLLGANRHDDHPEFGPAFVPGYIEYDIQVMKRAGFTGFRPAHYPATSFLLDKADEIGLLIMEEVPHYIMTPEMMLEPPRLESGRRMLKEMIMAHCNHPSIIIWSMANECRADLPQSKSMINELVKISKMMDSTRLVHFTGYPGIANFAEVNIDIAGINVYYGDSVSGRTTSSEVLGGVLDNLRMFFEDEDVGMAHVPLFLTEFGSQTVYGYHDISPYAGSDGSKSSYTVFTEERQAFVIESFIEQIKTRPFVAGILVWVWRDNRFEPGIANSSAGQIMRYGLLDWSGNPKLAFHILSRLFKNLNKERNELWPVSIS
jgi:beta-glucuronidase